MLPHTERSFLILSATLRKAIIATWLSIVLMAGTAQRRFHLPPASGNTIGGCCQHAVLELDQDQGCNAVYGPVLPHGAWTAALDPEGLRNMRMTSG